MTEAEKICNALLINFGKLTLATMILPIIVAFIKLKYLNKILKFFLYYCFATFSLNLLDILYIAAVNNYTDLFDKWLIITDGNVSFSMIIHQLKNFILLGWFYSRLLNEYSIGKWIWKLSLVLCTVVTISYIMEKGWKNYGVFGPTVEAIFLFTVPLLYLWYLYKSNLAFPFTKNSYFWISFGLAVTNLIGLFLYFTGDIILKEDFCLFVRFSTVRNFIEMIAQILLAIGFYHAPYAKYVTPSKEE